VPAGGYDIVVRPGLLRDVPSLVATLAPAARYAIISDATVAELYGGGVVAAMRSAGLDAELVRFPAGEASKTREQWARLTDELLALRLGRDGCVIALGGGVTGDLAGFVAATYMRGIPFVQVPTTLLAMIDAAVGGKTGVDTPAGKNLVGAFHQPKTVLVDPRVLQTLPAAEVRSGLAEAVKHAAIADARHFDALAAAASALCEADAEALAPVIARSIEIKAGVVGADPFEAGPRKALNFGHTIGHALETLSDYGMAHGYAVAAGMVAEAELGEAVGFTERGTAERLRELLRGLGLPTGLPAGAEPSAVLEVARSDKKAREARTEYTLLARIGEVARSGGKWTHPLPEDLVLAVLARESEPGGESRVSPNDGTI